MRMRLGGSRGSWGGCERRGEDGAWIGCSLVGLGLRVCFVVIISNRLCACRRAWVGSPEGSVCRGVVPRGGVHLASGRMAARIASNICRWCRLHVWFGIGRRLADGGGGYPWRRRLRRPSRSRWISASRSAADCLSLRLVTHLVGIAMGWFRRYAKGALTPPEIVIHPPRDDVGGPTINVTADDEERVHRRWDGVVVNPDGELTAVRRGLGHADLGC